MVEIVVTVGILALLSGAAADLFINIFPKKGNIVSEQLSTQNETRKAIDEFENEIRGATYSSIGSYPIEEASSTEIVFFTNPGAGALRSRVRYYVVGTTMMKGVVNPAGNPLAYNTSTEVVTEVLHGVMPTTTIFTYFDAGYTGNQDPMPQPVQVGQIRMVGIRVTIDKNPFNSPNQFTSESKAIIRNLISN